MNFPNPTPIKIGLEASFAGKQYRVVGRAVLGVVEDGQVYYWNEYYLETDGSPTATLVFEDTEGGPEWKMFTMFEPQFPMSAEDAAAKRAGDLINLDGVNCRVTRVDHSRIYYIEGKAPEGEVVNAAADYFNAVDRGKMIVVSWTGDEVECYRGLTITSAMVASAFNLEKAAFELEKGPLMRFRPSGGATSPQAKQLFNIIAVVAVVLVILAIKSDSLPMSRAPAVKVFTAPSVSFELSGEGTLNGTKYRIEARALVEVDEVGARSRRHEYFLTNDEGGSALLIEGMQPGTKDWVLFTPLSPVEAMTPQQAAKVTVGQIVNVDGVVAAVTEIFRSTAILQDDVLARKGDDVRFGFLARQNTTLLMARWNANEIIFRRGTPLTEKEIKAFGKAGK